MSVPRNTRLNSLNNVARNAALSRRSPRDLESGEVNGPGATLRKVTHVVLLVLIISLLLCVYLLILRILYAQVQYNKIKMSVLYHQRLVDYDLHLGHRPFVLDEDDGKHVLDALDIKSENFDEKVNASVSSELSELRMGPGHGVNAHDRFSMIDSEDTSEGNDVDSEDTSEGNDVDISDGHDHNETNVTDGADQTSFQSWNLCACLTYIWNFFINLFGRLLHND